jgi:hypothetical protein
MSASLTFVDDNAQPKRSRRYMVYIVAGLVSVFVIIYASVALVQSYENKGGEDNAETSTSQMHASPVATSETALKSGRVNNLTILAFYASFESFSVLYPH